MPIRPTIFIRARNEAEALPPTLRAVIEQSHPLEQLIVLDHASQDGTANVARSMGAEVYPIGEDEFSYGRALNRSLLYARGDVIVFLSAHCRPLHRRWLEDLLRPLANDRVGATFGRQVARRGVNPFEAWETLRAFPPTPSPLFRALGCQSPRFSNANAAVRTASLRRHPFDESLSFAEDVAWEREMRGAGEGVVYVAKAAVEHSHAMGPLQIERRMQLVGRAVVERGDDTVFRHAPVRWLALFACCGIDLAYCATTGQFGWMPRSWSYRRAQLRGLAEGLTAAGGAR